MGEPEGTPDPVVVPPTKAVGVLGKILVPTGNTFIGDAVSPTFSLTVVLGTIEAVEGMDEAAGIVVLTACWVVFKLEVVVVVA